MSKVPFQLLELSVISAQDLAPVSRNLRTYAVTWINPERKLRTRIDQQGHINPTWNDKFVFRVDDKFLDSDTAAVMIEVYALGWLRDVQVGSVRVLISNLIPQAIREQNISSRRFVALQIRRPSGRPQGILNMGVTILDNTMRSMPLYTELSASAVGYRDLMDGKAFKPHKEDEQKQAKSGKGKKEDEDKGGKNDKEKKEEVNTSSETIKLWRSRSDRTDLNSTGIKKTGRRPGPGGSLCGGSMVNGGSMLNGGSLLNGGSALNGGSMLNGSEVGGPNKGGSMISDVGPSPSVVAAAVAKGLYPTQLPVPHQAGSSILGDWTVEESSVEGLKSKIDRWRMELPPMYDTNNFNRINGKNSRSTPRHTPRRRSGSHGGGPGLFSCFGNVYGCEITIVCGGNEGKKNLHRCDSSKINSDSDLYS